MAALDEIRARWSNESVYYSAPVLAKILARGIEPAHCRQVIFSPEAEVIQGEEDPGATAYTVYGRADDGRILHVVPTMGARLKVATAYDPSIDPKNRWEADLKTKRGAAAEGGEGLD